MILSIPPADQTTGLIRRIEALNYCGLRYVSQALRPFQVLVGPNASGKSTFLDVPALVSDFIRHDLDHALLFGVETSSGRARSLDELIFNRGANHFELALEMTIPSELVRPNSTSGAEYIYDIARYELAVGTTQQGELDVRSEALFLIDSRYHTEDTQSAAAQAPTDSFPFVSSPPPSLVHPSLVAVGQQVMRDAALPAWWEPVVAQDPDRRGNAMYLAETERWGLINRVGVRRSALAGLSEDPARFPVAI